METVTVVAPWALTAGTDEPRSADIVAASTSSRMLLLLTGLSSSCVRARRGGQTKQQPKREHMSCQVNNTQTAWVNGAKVHALACGSLPRRCRQQSTGVCVPWRIPQGLQFPATHPQGGKNAVEFPSATFGPRAFPQQRLATTEFPHLFFFADNNSTAK